MQESNSTCKLANDTSALGSLVAPVVGTCLRTCKAPGLAKHEKGETFSLMRIAYDEL